MKKKVLKKLKSRGGETLAEVLIALLISALALTMLAGMVSVSGNLVLNSMDRMEEYVAAENDIVSYTASDSAVGSITLNMTGSGDLKITEKCDVSLPVSFYKSRVIGKVAVVSYKVK